ncbi:MAG: rhodanese-like domain-containing protein [Schleiferiaceae bacterium]|jgi:rhodanese-related sulfurtransferase|nr:rhodanese-like domain-containing protein [Schleiferiaceae bacterium]
MKKILLASLSVVILASCGNGENADSQEENVGTEVVTSVGTFYNISTAEAANMIEEGDVVIMDVRSLDEFESGHIIGAMNQDVRNEDFTESIKKMDKSKTYVVYCHSGRRSAHASEILKDNGFTKVYNVQGGISAWQQDGYEVQ